MTGPIQFHLVLPPPSHHPTWPRVPAAWVVGGAQGPGSPSWEGSQRALQVGTGHPPSPQPWYPRLWRRSPGGDGRAGLLNLLLQKWKGSQKGGRKCFPGGAVVENLPANAEDMGSSPGLGRSHMPRHVEQLGPWATTTEPARLEPVLRNKRGRDSERPAHRDEKWPRLAATRKSPRTETKTQHSHN